MKRWYKTITLIIVLILGVTLINFRSFANVKLLSNQSSSEEAQSLALNEFYKSNPYETILIDNSSGEDETVNPLVEPEMGWQTNGKPAENPTKVAAEGLSLALNGKIGFAKKHAEWLLNNSVEIESGIFFPFHFKFAPYWPFSLEAPWNSGLTQGLALGLFSYLYKYTGDTQYKSIADKIYRSYSVPLERGGFVRYEDDGPFIEEYPTKIPTRVLNGSLVSMLAVYDYGRITGNSQAAEFFQRCVSRFEKLLPSYDLSLPQYDFTLSSYSLAPARKEVLARFIGEGKAVIEKLQLVGVIGNKEEVISNVEVGTETDNDVMNPIYIWADNKNMNWGDRVLDINNKGRVVNGNQGVYNHSPFKFAFPDDYEKYDDIYIQIDYKPLDEKNIDLQLFDENEFWLLGTINKEGNSGVEKKNRFKIDKNFINSWLKQVKTYSLPDNRYLDDNQGLVKLVAKESKSHVFQMYADKWEKANVLVPSRFLNKKQENILKNTSSYEFKNLNSEKLGLKEIVSSKVVKLGKTYFQYYAGKGLDNKSRIYLATSEDGTNWQTQGQLFNDASLPFKGGYAYPTVVEGKDEKGSKEYFMYFSASNDENKSYNSIYFAKSKDGWHWDVQNIILDDNATNIDVVQDTKGKFKLLYITDDGEQSQVKEIVSSDGKRWSTPKIILNKSRRMGEALDSLAITVLNSTELLFVGTQTVSRHQMEVYDITNAKATSIFDDPYFIADEDWNSTWDACRYGYDILKENNNYYLIFIGKQSSGTNGTNTIGRCEIDIESLNKQIVKKKVFFLFH